MKDRIVTVAESGNGPFGQFITTGHHVLGADEMEFLGGRDTGPDPYELLLGALGACTAMSLRLYADRHKWPLEHVEVTLRHARPAAHQSGVKDSFERKIELEGALTEEQKLKLVEIVGRCPVSRTLEHGAEIVTALG